jgi:hypothetical protein
MDIRFVSSLTPEDENLFAPALLKAVGALMDLLPIAYTLRIETTGAQIFQHSHAAAADAARRELTDAVSATPGYVGRRNGLPRSYDGALDRD